MFKIISKILLHMFHILLDSWNILIESNELSAILDYWGYAWYVTSGVTQVFFISTASDQYEPETRFWLLVQILNWIKTI